MPVSTQAPYTVLRNISGSAMFFAFAGRHGAYLEDDEDVAIPGSIWDLWHKNKAQLDALEYALNNDYVTILKTPAVVVFDETDEVVKQISVDNGAVVDVDPDYGSYAGDPPDV